MAIEFLKVGGTSPHSMSFLEDYIGFYSSISRNCGWKKESWPASHTVPSVCRSYFPNICCAPTYSTAWYLRSSWRQLAPWPSILYNGGNQLVLWFPIFCFFRFVVWARCFRRLTPDNDAGSTPGHNIYQQCCFPVCCSSCFDRVAFGRHSSISNNYYCDNLCF